MKYQAGYMLAPLETRTCLLQVLVPLDSTQSHGIDIDYSCSPLCDLITPILSLACMKTRHVGIKSEKRLK